MPNSVIPNLGRDLPDLGRVKKPPAQGMVEAMLGFELLNGMRCGGCFRRIKKGLRIIRFNPQIGADGQPQMKKGMKAACLRPDCEYAKTAKAGATAAEPIEYIFIKTDPDEDGSRTRALVSGPDTPG